MSTRILGISAFYHDSAAALLVDGQVIAAAQEERFTRVKQDASFPAQAVQFVLGEGGLSSSELTAIAFYDKPLLKFERLVETYHAFAPRGVAGFVRAMPVWIKEKLFMKKLLRKRLAISGELPILFPEHHLSHAASAFYPAPYETAAILTIDGVGEWATTTIGEGTGNKIKICSELRFPHSIGLLYAAFTYFLGFRVNSDEYKVMGLAPYGDPGSGEAKGFVAKIRERLVDIREDGSLLLNMSYFDFAVGFKMANDKKWEALFGMPRRAPESSILPGHMNLAWAIQEVTNEVVVALARQARKITGCKNLVMAGGVALNCVANSRVRAAGLFDHIWIQPAAGDAGGALGAAYAAYHIYYGNERSGTPTVDGMRGAYLGPSFEEKTIRQLIRREEAVAERVGDFEALTSRVAALLADGKVVGWFQGNMEFGPRALGNRSILGDPRNPEMQRLLNLKIKFREGFRPFAPSVMEEDVSRFFNPDTASPYMLFVAQIKDLFDPAGEQARASTSWEDRLKLIRSVVPAVTHVDGSSRVQVVTKTANPRFWALLSAFKKITGMGMLINTSFNVRDEPIVCTPADAYRCLMHTQMDYLVLGDYLFDRRAQKQPDNGSTPDSGKEDGAVSKA